MGGLCILSGGEKMKQMLKVKDIQHICNISRSEAYKLVNSGEFPIVRIGRAIRIPRLKFEEWLQKNKKWYHKSKKGVVLMGKRANGEGTIYQRKDGRWVAQITYVANDGQKKRKTFYGTQQQEVVEKNEEIYSRHRKKRSY